MEQMQNKCILCGTTELGCVPKGHIQVPLCCTECSLDCEIWVLSSINKRLQRNRPLVNPTGICLLCNKEFSRGNGTQKFCGEVCRAKHRKQYDTSRYRRKRMTMAICVICNKTFQKHRSAKTCSDECSVKLARLYGAASERKRRERMAQRKQT